MSLQVFLNLFEAFLNHHYYTYHALQPITFTLVFEHTLQMFANL